MTFSSPKLKMNFDEIVKGIKDLEIQGAENIAKAACEALRDISENSKAKTKEEFIEETSKAKGTLFMTRPTEPFMRNSLNYLFFNIKGKDIRELKRNLDPTAMIGLCANKVDIMF